MDKYQKVWENQILAKMKNIWNLILTQLVGDRLIPIFCWVNWISKQAYTKFITQSHSQIHIQE